MAASLLDEADIFFEIFLAEIEAMVAGEPLLIEMLQWAARRTDAVAAPYQPEAMRSAYLSFALARPRALARALALALAPALCAGL